jgi:regulatory protein
MARRGLGARRVAGALRQAGIAADDADAIAPAVADRSIDAAINYARRRRIGPFADQPGDRPTREKHVAALLRAGHSLELARSLAGMDPGDDPAELLG